MMSRQVPWLVRGEGIQNGPSMVAVLNALSPKNTPMCDSISTAHCRSHSHFKLATQEAGSSRCFSPNRINSYSLVTKMFSNPTHCYRFWTKVNGISCRNFLENYYVLNSFGLIKFCSRNCRQSHFKNFLMRFINRTWSWFSSLKFNVWDFCSCL